MNVVEYEGSMEQAETACASSIADILDLQLGQDMTVAAPNGRADAAVFDIGALGIGDTTTFPSKANCFRATLDLYNRDRSKLQRWIMRLLEAFPVNGWYHADDPLREVENVAHVRVAPERGAISKIAKTTVASSNSGDVPTWTCSVAMDVVFVNDAY